MPSAAQKQRRRKLKQKKEQKKGQNDDRIEPYVRRRIRRATESLSSNYVLVDPVFAADGHTYSRAEIQAWLATGKRTSPKTNEPLAHTTLTPNHLVRSMVQEYLDKAKKASC